MGSKLTRVQFTATEKYNIIARLIFKRSQHTMMIALPLGYVGTISGFAHALHKRIT